MIKWIFLLVVLYINTTCLVLAGSLKTKEAEYFRIFKDFKESAIKAGLPLDKIVVETRKESAFYYWTGIKTTREAIF